MGTPTLPLPLFSRLLLRLLLGWLPPLLPLLVVSRAANTSDHKHSLTHTHAHSLAHTVVHSDSDYIVMR